MTDPATLAYDGQNFFDTDHVHPNDKLFSNIVTLGTDVDGRADVAEPTPQEVRQELKVVMARLLTNSLIQNSLVRTSEIKKSLAVTARSFETWSAFNDLLEEEEIEGMPNRFRGKFELLQDQNPRPGLENSYDVIKATPGGPRPVIFVSGKEPSGVEFDLANKFAKSRIPFGMNGIYAVAAGFPQTTVRVQ